MSNAGNGNVAIGSDALVWNDGNDNVAIGTSAMSSMLAGAECVGIGANALQNNTGLFNTGIGFNVLKLNTGGTYNVGVGHNAGDTLSSGSKNILIGTKANASSTAGVNQIVIGDIVSGHGDNIAVIGNAACTAWHPAIPGVTSLGGSGFEFQSIHSVNAVTVTSDLNKKKDINNLIIGLDFINDLRPVEYKWKEGSDTNKHYGLIAQEVEVTLQKNNIYNNNELIHYSDESKTYGIKYTELIAPLIKSVQELTTRNETLQSQLAAVLVRLDALETK